jgi:hypothetical protein
MCHTPVLFKQNFVSIINSIIEILIYSSNMDSYKFHSNHGLHIQFKDKLKFNFLVAI